MLSDIKIAFRQLRRTPLQTLIAIFTLALGIGLASSMGSLLKALVLDPFKFPESDRIVQIWNQPGWPLSGPDYQDLREQSTSFESFGAYTMESYNVGGNAPASVHGAKATAEVLQTLDVKPRLGRWLQPEDELEGAAAVAVISDGLWKRSFASDEEVIGRHVLINGIDTEIIGVMPPDFEFTVAWFNTNILRGCSIWTPLQTSKFQGRGNHWMVGLARLKDGISKEAADAEAKSIAARLQKLYPDTNEGKPLTVRSLSEELLDGLGIAIVPGTRKMGWLLFASGMFVLLLACSNVACLLIAQGTARQREFSVRLALGAGRWNIVRLVLSESAILAICGALLGLIFALWGTSLLATYAPLPAGRESAIQVDWLVFSFAMLLVFVATLFVGLPSAFATRDSKAADALRSGGRGQMGTRQRHRLLRSLVIAQIAVALLLANTAALFATSYRKILASNQIMATTHVLAGSVTLRGKRYADKEAKARTVEQLLQQVRALPGVKSASVTSKLPLQGGNNRNIYVGSADGARNISPVETSSVVGDYFATAGIAILKGRSFTVDDENASATGIVINRALAERAWPGEDPIGQLVYFSQDLNTKNSNVVIGVAEDVRQWGAEGGIQAEMYSPYARRATEEFFLVVSSTQDVRPLSKLLREVVSGIDPDLPIGDLITWQGLLNKSLHYRSFIAVSMVGLVACAIGLAMVGIYGTFSYYVAERTREIGVRMALGATPISILRLVLHRIGVWLCIGVVIGGAGIFGVSRVLQAMLYEMQPVHVPTFIGSIVLVLLAGVLAGLAPALRATKIEPLEALRAD